MKPLVSALSAWSCIVISIFAIVILSAIGGLFSSNSHSMMGSTEDPENGKSVAGAIFGAVIIYAGFLFFCATQALWHWRNSRKGAIQLN